MTGTMQNDEARPESPDVSDRTRSRIGSTTDTRENGASAALHQVDRVDEQKASRHHALTFVRRFINGVSCESHVH
jgi:hypothetical protein